MSQEHPRTRPPTDELDILPEEFEETTDDQGDGLEIDASQSEEIQRIFGTTLPQYLEPVEEMVEQILADSASGDTVTALAGTLASLSQAAARVGFEQVVGQLDRFHHLVLDLGDEAEHKDVAATHAAIQATLAELQRMAGQLAGGESPDQADRCPTIFQAMQDRGIGPAELGGQDVLHKLSAAGVTRVDQLREARPDEVAAVSGLELELVQRLIARLLSPDAVTPSDASAPDPSGAEAATSEVSAPAASGPEAVASEASAPAASDDQTPEAALRRQLRAQVEAEAGLEEIRARLSRLRASVKRRHAELQRLEQHTGDLDERCVQIAKKRARRSEELIEVRQIRDALEIKYARNAEDLHRRHQRLVELRLRHQQLTRSDTALDREVDRLVARVRGVLGRVAERGAGRPIGTMKR